MMRPASEPNVVLAYVLTGGGAEGLAASVDEGFDACLLGGQFGQECGVGGELLPSIWVSVREMFAQALLQRSWLGVRWTPGLPRFGSQSALSGSWLQASRAC
jgi:hypothetical protein